MDAHTVEPPAVDGSRSTPGRADEPPIRVLGPVGLAADGRVTTISAGRARALLALLARRPGQVVSVSRLIDELWDEEPPASAATALRVHVGNVRTALAERGGGVTVEHRAPGYVLVARPDQVDAGRAQAAVRHASEAPVSEVVARCEGALGLWRGVPYEDVALRAVEPDRHRLAELRFELLELRAQTKARLAPPDAHLVAELEALVAEAPLRERPTELLALALYQRGREVDALAAVSRIRRRLADDLGLVPSRSLQQLETAILCQDEALEWTPPVTAIGTVSTAAPTAPLPPMTPVEPADTDRSPLVGRDAEVEQIVARWRAGSGTGVTLVQGESGVGKTRLLDGATVRLRTLGATVVRGTCDAYGSVPYRPFLEVLRQLRGAERDPIDELAATPAAPGGGGDERLRIFAAVLAELERAAQAANGNLVVALDDLHWIDEASASLLRFVVEAHPPVPLFVLGAARDDLLADRASVWSTLRASLLRRRPDAGAAQVLDLVGLGRAHVADLVHQLTGHEDADDLAALLHARTTGNPLLVTELLHHLEPRLAQGAGIDELAAVPLPQGISDALRIRLAGLDDRARCVVEVAAVAGARPSSALVADVLRVERADVFAGRADAVAAGVFVDDDADPDAIVFRHALVRDAVVHELPSSRRRHLHVRIAHALLAEVAPPAAVDDHGEPAAGPPAAPDRPTVARLLGAARHLLDGIPACRPLDAAHAAADAADAALRVYAFGDAAALADRALAVLARNGGDPATQFRLLVHSGEAKAQLGRHDAAREAFGRAAAEARQLGDPHLLAAAALSGDLPDRPLGGAIRQEPLLDEALAALEGHRCPSAIRVMGALASDGATPGRFVDRRALADDAVALARSAGGARDLFGALWAWLQQHVTDPPAERVVVADELVRLAEVTGDAVLATRARLVRARERLSTGDAGAAEADVEALRALTARTGRPRDEWQLSVVDAALAGWRGDLARADELADAAARCADRHGILDGTLTYGVHLFFRELHHGRLAALRPALEDYRDQHPTFRSLRAAVLIARADAGDHDLAAEIEAVLADPQPDELQASALVMAADAAVRAGVPGVAPTLRAGLEPLAGTIVVAGALSGIFGPADRYRAMVARLDGDHTEAISLAAAAAERCDAMGSSLWSLWCRAEEALARAAAGSGTAATLATAVAHQAEDLGAAGPARAVAALLTGDRASTPTLAGS